MRSFFISSALLTIVGSLSFFIGKDFIEIHRLFFLSIVPSFTYGGFLLTAIPDWSHYSGKLRPFSFSFYAILFTALLFLFWLPQVSMWLVAVFWVLMFCFSAYLLYLDRNRDNFVVLFLLALFAILQTAYAYEMAPKFLRLQLHLNIAAIIYISFRISVMMGAEALKSTTLKDPIFIPNAVYRNLAVTFLCCYIVSELYLPVRVSGFIAIGIGLVLLAKLKELHHSELLRHYYLVIYYLVQLCGGIGYLWLGYEQLTLEYTFNPYHLVAISYFFGVLFFVQMIAGIRHSGFKELNIPMLSRIAIVLILLSAATRALLSEYSEGLYVHLPATLLILACVFYLINYLKIFMHNAFSDDPD